MNWKDEIERMAKIKYPQESGLEFMCRSKYAEGANWLLEKLQPYIDYYGHMKTRNIHEGLQEWHQRYKELVKQIEELEK